MKLLKVDVINEAELLFKLDNSVFNKEFDIPSRTVQEQKEYLQGSETYIAYDTQEAIGFFAFKQKGEDIELLSIAVTPSNQRKGYGTIMMKKLFEQNKNKIIHLVTHPKNSSAIIYYLQFGFEIYGWKENYYGDGQPRLLLKFDPKIIINHCESCGMPLDAKTESKNDYRYCIYCQNQQTGTLRTKQEVREGSIGAAMRLMGKTRGEAEKMADEMMPQLPRWKNN